MQPLMISEVVRMYEIDLEFDPRDLEFMFDEPLEGNEEESVPTKVDARRLIERWVELKQLRELLDDPCLEYFE